MQALNDVLKELNVVVNHKIKQAENDWLFMIGRPTRDLCPPPPEQCYILYSEVEDNPQIYDEEAAALRRHFKPPKRGPIQTLGL